MAAAKEQVQNQSVKTTFQAKQLDKPAYTGLPQDLLAPYAEGSLEALAANKRRMEEEGFELRMVFNDQTKQWESKYLPKQMGPTKVTSPTNLQREQLSTIYDSILAEQNQKYSRLITDLPTMEDSLLENLVIARESFPLEIRTMILDEYKTRINYYDRIRNPQNYPGEPSPLLPKAGTTLPTIEGEE